MKNNMDIRSEALQRGLQLLRAAQVRFKVITEDGAEYGDLEVVKTKPRTRSRGTKYKVGTIRRYYLPLIESMQPEEVRFVPVGEFDLDTLQGGISAYASAHWGNKSVITRKDEERNGIEILRVY